MSDDDGDDDENDDDEDYLQKFDTDIKKNYIVDYHPECMIHNYEEISALTKVIRDKDNVIVDPLHRTIPYLTKYERARVLGQRAKQINLGARPFVKVPENIIDGNLVAEMELAQKRIPFIIRRPLPGNSGSEYWNLKDLEIITF
jgi:DNA-directed RNA polymerase subunit K/omega